MADEKKPKLPDWIQWTTRGDPRLGRPAFSSSEFYEKLSAPPSRLKELAMCCWTDLLGFGDALREAQWHPSETLWQALHERITDAHLCCFQSLDLVTETVLALNDGIVRCYDSAISRIPLLSMWLRACVITHNWINDRESSKGLPGARTVLSCGEQMSFSHPEYRLSDFIFKPTTAPGNRSTSMLGNPANRPIIIHPTQLQLNLAFSRAYLLDQAGSKAGVKGAHFYIDQTVIDVLSQEASSWGMEILDTTDEMGRLFAIATHNRQGYYDLGLFLQSASISVETPQISTTVWQVLGYCPWDEPQPFGFTVV